MSKGLFRLLTRVILLAIISMIITYSFYNLINNYLPFLKDIVPSDTMKIFIPIYLIGLILSIVGFIVKGIFKGVLSIGSVVIVIYLLSTYVFNLKIPIITEVLSKAATWVP